MSQPIPERKIQALQKWRSKLSPAHPDSRSCRGAGKEVNPSIKEMKALLYWILRKFDPSFSSDFAPPGIRDVPEFVYNQLMYEFWAPVRDFNTARAPLGSAYQARVNAYKKNLIAFARRPLGRKSIKRFVDQIRKLIRLSQAELEVISKGLAGDKGKYLTLFRDDKYPDIEIGLTTIALKQLGARYHHCLGQATGSGQTPKIAIAFPDTEVHYFEYNSKYQECKKAWNKDCGYSVRKKKITWELKRKYRYLARGMAKSRDWNSPGLDALGWVMEESAAYQAVIEILKRIDEGLSSAVTLVSESGLDVLKDHISDALKASDVDPLLLYLQTSMPYSDQRALESLVGSIKRNTEEVFYDEAQVWDLLADYLYQIMKLEYPGALEYLKQISLRDSNLDEMYNYIVEHFGQDSMRSQYDRESFSRKSRKGQSGSGVSTVRRTRRKASRERTHQKRKARKSMERQGVAKWNPARREWLRNNPKPIWSAKNPMRIKLPARNRTLASLKTDLSRIGLGVLGLHLAGNTLRSCSTIAAYVSGYLQERGWDVDWERSWGHSNHFNLSVFTTKGWLGVDPTYMQFKVRFDSDAETDEDLEKDLGPMLDYFVSILENPLNAFMLSPVSQDKKKSKPISFESATHNYKSWVDFWERKKDKLIRSLSKKYRFETTYTYLLRTFRAKAVNSFLRRQGLVKWNPDTKEKPKPKTAEDMSVVDHLSLTEAPSSVDELWGPWQQANSAELKEVYKLGMYASGPWLTQRLREVGFQKGRRLGAGSFGTVYALKNLNMEPTPWVAKVTGDVNEIAFVHRIIDLGIESSALPRVFGAWFSKPGIGLIIREDLYVHIASHFSSQMLRAIRRAAPFWFVGDEPELLPILPYEVAVFKRFSNEILRMKRLYGFSFIDLRPVNIRLRSTRAGQDELVISDFGMVSGPATKIPVIRNPRRRKFRS